MAENIFSSLFRWGDSTSQPENYYSKGLTLILSHLLNSADNRYRLAAVNILNAAFAKRLGFSFNINDNIVIQSHKKMDNKKIPDITIIAENKLIFVEIKVGSGVDKRARESLKDYKKQLLEQKMAKSNGLILITKFGDGYVGSIPLEQTSWFTLSGVLRDALQDIKKDERVDSVSIYLLENFLEFLKENDMSIEKVENNIDPATVYNVIKLLKILKLICTELNLSKNPKLEAEVRSQAEESWLGYYVKNKTCAIGIYAMNPIQCYFEIYEHDVIKRLFASEEQVKRKIHKDAELWGDDTIALRLDLGLKGFFEQDVNEAVQAKIIKEYVREIKERWDRFNKTGHTNVSRL